MNRKKKHVPQKTQSVGPKTPKKTFGMPAVGWMPTLIGFVVTWLLMSWVYGDVLWRVEQESYVTADAAMMKPLTDTTWGWMAYAGRWLLTTWKYPWLGGLLLALLLTASAELLSDALRLPLRWKWTAHLLSLAFFGWLLWRGFNLYFRSEPSAVIIAATILAGVVSLAALIRWVGDKRPLARSSRVRTGGAVAVILLFAVCVGCSFLHLSWRVAAWLLLFFTVYALAALLLLFRRKSETDVAPKLFSLGNLLLPLLGIGMGFAASHINDSVIATARMQRLMEDQNWEAMCETALKISRPTRSVAAYYALALEQQDALLDDLFDLPFDFPKVDFDEDIPADEYALFAADCNLAAGLPNSAYHEAFEQIVMTGMSLHWLKTMAKAAVLNGEERLAKKYMAIIRSNPFEQAFCNRIEPMIADTTLIRQDSELAHILQLAPRDKRPFEQGFRKPVFLGYNVGLNEGPDHVLRTSAAACLYSKDLAQFVPRAQVFVAKKWPLPECMQQALVIYSIKHGGADFLKQFQGAISPMTEQTIAAFSRDLQPFSRDKEAMRRELKKDWLGTYVYYYYCENNNPEQVREKKSAGVN